MVILYVMDPNQPGILKERIFFVMFCYKVPHMSRRWRKNVKMGFDGIITSDSVEDLLPRELAGSSHVFSKQSNALDSGKVWANLFKYD